MLYCRDEEDTEHSWSLQRSLGHVAGEARGLRSMRLGRSAEPVRSLQPSSLAHREDLAACLEPLSWTVVSTGSP